MEFHYVTTSDSLRLLGVHYPAALRDTLILYVHGMSGNIIESYFAHVLGESSAAAGVGFLYAHNRGYNHVNDIMRRREQRAEGSPGDPMTVRCGTAYELFPDCLFDIDVWLQKCLELGYQQIVLMGHSLGCNKIIYYFSERKPGAIIAMILASPPDLVGLVKLPASQPNNAALFEESRRNMTNGQPRKLLSEMIWSSYLLSSQTFLSLFSEGAEADNLPLLRNPERFTQLAKVNVPILAFMGEKDDIAIRSISEDLQMLSSKASACPAFRKEIIANSDHLYDQQEGVVSNLICAWVAEVCAARRCSQR